MTQIIGTSIQLFRLSYSLTTSIMFTMPLVYVSMNIYGSFLRRISRKARLAESEASGIAGEVQLFPC
jgi:ATP-binding cassette subfamily B (MDR/TAP) protein 8